MLTRTSTTPPFHASPLFAALLTLSAGHVPTAHAQQVAQATLTPVIVTSEKGGSEGYTPTTTNTGKIPVPLADLPSSVTIIPKEALDEQASKTLGQALTNASGAQPVYGGGYGFADAFVIRGLRARFLRDGLPDGPPLLNYSRSFADVEAVEVLKGPGSAIYGNGAPGGVINLVSKQPQRKFLAAGTVSIGGLGLRQATADVSGPLSEAWSGRLIANDYHQDGIRGLSSDIRELIGRLDYRHDAANRVKLSWEHRENRFVPDNYGIPFNTSRQIVSAPRESRYYSPFNHADQDINRLGAVHELEMSPTASLRTALVHDRRDTDVARNAGGNPVNAAGAFTGRNGRTQTDKATFTNLSSELTLMTGGSLPQTILLGAEYERVRDATARYTYALPSITNALAPTVPETTLAGLATTRNFDKKIGSETVSLYAQDQIEISHQWKARAGLRVDRAHWFDEGFGNSLTTPTVANVFRKLDVRETLPSWQVGAVYRSSSQVSFFGGYTQGRFISIQSESANLDRAAERSSQIELGAKTSWLNDKLNVNATLFETKRQNYLVALTPGTDPQPVGRSKSRGLEVDVIGNPVPGWNLIASASHVNARSTGNELANVPGVTTGTGESVNGRFLATTPANAYSLWSSYTLQSGLLQGVGFGLGAVHKGAAFVDAIEKLRVPGYTVFNAAVFYKMRNAEVALNIKNLTNRSYFSVPTFAGALPGDPRQAILSLKLWM
jgi:iron complex outermembrane receptor protein